VRVDHGYNRYTSKVNPCRCDECRAAKQQYMADQRSQRSGLAFGDSRHGTRHGYDNYRCRCQQCVDAKRRTRRRAS